MPTMRWSLLSLLCVYGGDTKMYIELNSIPFVSLTKLQMTHVFHMAFGPLRIALPRKRIVKQRHCS